MKKNKFIKYNLLLSVLLVFSFLFGVNTVNAQYGVDYGGGYPDLVDSLGDGEDIFGLGYVGELGLSSGEGIDLHTMIVNILRYLLTFIGIIAIVIVMLAGLKWMASGGDAEKVGQAKSMLVGSFIGLIIIMAAYSITNFVISSVSGALAGGISGI